MHSSCSRRCQSRSPWLWRTVVGMVSKRYLDESESASTRKVTRTLLFFLKAIWIKRVGILILRGKIWKQDKVRAIVCFRTLIYRSLRQHFILLSVPLSYIPLPLTSNLQHPLSLSPTTLSFSLTYNTLLIFSPHFFTPIMTDCKNWLAGVCPFKVCSFKHDPAKKGTGPPRKITNKHCKHWLNGLCLRRDEACLFQHYPEKRGQVIKGKFNWSHLIHSCN